MKRTISIIVSLLMVLLTCPISNDTVNAIFIYNNNVYSEHEVFNMDNPPNFEPLRTITCPKCNGDRRIKTDEIVQYPCLFCNNGVYHNNRTNQLEICPLCNGLTYYYDYKSVTCPTCNGKGTIDSSQVTTTPATTRKTTTKTTTTTTTTTTATTTTPLSTEPIGFSKINEDELIGKWEFSWLIRDSVRENSLLGGGFQYYVFNSDYTGYILYGDSSYTSLTKFNWSLSGETVIFLNYVDSNNTIKLYYSSGHLVESSMYATYYYDKAASDNNDGIQTSVVTTQYQESTYTTTEPVTTVYTTTEPVTTVYTTTELVTTVYTTTEPVTTVYTTTEPVTTVYTTTEPGLDYTLGDMNKDGKVDAKDASLILAEYSKLSTGGINELSDEMKKTADANYDGKVDAKDASTLLAYYAYISTGGTSSIIQYIAEMSNTSSETQTTTTMTVASETTTTATTTVTTTTTTTLDLVTPNVKCLFCEHEFFTTGVGNYGLLCPNCKKLFLPNNPQTEKDEIYAKKYPGIWHTDSSDEHELTIHVLNSSQVLFSIWYYKLWGMDFSYAQFQGNKAYFTSDNGSVSGYLTFNDNSIGLTFTESSNDWIKVNVEELYDQNGLYSIQHGVQLTDIDEYYHPSITSNYVGLWRIIGTNDEDLNIKEVTGQGVSFTIAYGTLHTFECYTTSIDYKTASFYGKDEENDFISGEMIFNNDSIEVHVQSTDAIGIGGNTIATYHALYK